MTAGTGQASTEREETGCAPLAESGAGYQLLLKRHVGPLWPLLACSLAGGAALTALGQPLPALATAVMGGVGTALARRAFIRDQTAKNALIAELTAARDEARRANLAKSTFLATMSHEIRTPMNGVLGMAQLLRHSSLTSRQQDQVDTVIRSGELLMTILNDLLDMSRLDAGRMEIVTASCDVAALFHDMQAAWAPIAADRDLTLDLAFDETLPPYLMLDAARVRQVLFNLVGNALKFTREGGVSVTVGQDVRDGVARLTVAVRDTGDGISADVMPTLFEAFSQGDNSDVRKFGGTGLGLAICRQLCELMGGDISAEVRPGEGSTLRFNLPLAATDVTPQSIEPHAETEIFEEPRRLSILAADDNPTNLLVLEQLLGALGYHIYKANDGREALEALANQTFDLVLMDIQMPEMTGIDVLQAVRARPGPNQATPLIAVTADAMSAGRDRYLDLGFADYVAKPVQASNLITAMTAAVANDPHAVDDIAHTA